jgi:hypothetical protein
MPEGQVVWRCCRQCGGCCWVGAGVGGAWPWQGCGGRRWLRGRQLWLGLGCCVSSLCRCCMSCRRRWRSLFIARMAWSPFGAIKACGLCWTSGVNEQQLLLSVSVCALALVAVMNNIDLPRSWGDRRRRHKLSDGHRASQPASQSAPCARQRAPLAHPAHQQATFNSISPCLSACQCWPC